MEFVLHLHAIRNRHRAHRRRLVNMADPLVNMPDQEIVDEYRLTRELIYDLLLETVRGDLITSNYRNRAIPPIVQLCLGLKYMATGDMQRTVGKTLKVSQSQASKIIRNVTRAIARQAPHHIYMPRPEEQGRLMHNFFRKCQIPGVIGCIDGTHIRIQKPRQFENAYVNRKGYHSINVQVIADSDYIVRNVDARSVSVATVVYHYR